MWSPMLDWTDDSLYLGLCQPLFSSIFQTKFTQFFGECRTGCTCRARTCDGGCAFPQSCMADRWRVGHLLCRDGLVPGRVGPVCASRYVARFQREPVCRVCASLVALRW